MDIGRVVGVDVEIAGDHRAENVSAAVAGRWTHRRTTILRHTNLRDKRRLQRRWTRLGGHTRQRPRTWRRRVAGRDMHAVTAHTASKQPPWFIDNSDRAFSTYPKRVERMRRAVDSRRRHATSPSARQGRVSCRWSTAGWRLISRRPNGRWTDEPNDVVVVMPWNCPGGGITTITVHAMKQLTGVYVSYHSMTDDGGDFPVSAWSADCWRHRLGGEDATVVVVVVEMSIIKVALSHFCCRTTVQSDSVSVARQVTVVVVTRRQPHRRSRRRGFTPTTTPMRLSRCHRRETTSRTRWLIMQLCWLSNDSSISCASGRHAWLNIVASRNRNVDKIL